MRASKNTIYASDVTNLPIKVKYTSSYFCDTVENTGITINKGINKPIYSYQKPDNETLIYRLARHMYYTAFLTGSFPVSSSSYEHWMQSTAASGSAEANLRYFPTGANDEITVIAIPRTSFGEKVSPTTFRFATSGNRTLYDDGNGNIVYFNSEIEDRYIDYLYHTAPDDYYESFATLTGSVLIGNIFYSQGIVVLYSGTYYDDYIESCGICPASICGDTYEGYGYLYNWYAIGELSGQGVGGIINKYQPFDDDGRGAEWRVPTDEDWTDLATYLGGESVAGGKLKTICTAPFTINNGLWNAPNKGATNEVNWAGVPGGSRRTNGSFATINTFGNWWSSTEVNTDFAWYRFLNYNGDNVTRFNYNKTFGFSVRLVRPAVEDERALPDGTTSNDDTTIPHYYGNNNRVYITVKIGDQIWTAQNLLETLNNENVSIQRVTSNSAWAALTSAAWCSYNNGNITNDQGEIEICGTAILPDIPCGTPFTYGGNQAYPISQTIELGTDTGLVVYNFDAYQVPDRFIVRWNNSVVIDSGYVGISRFDLGGDLRSRFINSLIGKTDPITNTVYPDFTNFPDDGYPRITTPGNGSLSFTKNLAFPINAVVDVYGPIIGTGWVHTLYCPVIP